MDQLLAILNTNNIIQEHSNYSIISQPAQHNILVSAGAQGLPGKDGVQSNLAPMYKASTAIGGYRVVKAIGSGQIAYASSDSIGDANSIVGLTTNAVVQGAEVGVQFAGSITDGTWNLTVGPVYCGINGVITQTPPTEGFILVLGTAISSDTIVLNIKQPLFII